MSQIFKPSANTISRASVFGAGLIVAALGGAVFTITKSPYTTEATISKQQPVPFSHKHHVSDAGIDCRYCHSSVEKSSYAGIPSTKVCMTCHSQLFTDAPMLEPVRQGYQKDTALAWTRVHDLADFAYFDHSIHVNKGVGCVTCHGQVDQMPLMWKEKSLQMSWCLGCHRHPEKYVRPKDRVFDMTWKPHGDQIALGQKLVKEYKIQKLTNCTTCHR